MLLTLRKLQHHNNEPGFSPSNYWSIKVVLNFSMHVLHHTLTMITCPSQYRRELLRPPTGSIRPPGELQYNIYTDQEEILNLSLVARTQSNVLTLRSDFMVGVRV